MFTGCVASGHDDDLEFRANVMTYPGDGDIVIRSDGDDDVDIPDTVIWDLAGGNVTRQTEPGVFSSRLSVEGNQVRRSDPLLGPTPSCTVIDARHPSGEVYKLVDTSGEVVLTLRDRLVLVGDVDDPQGTSPSLAFSLDGANIFAGPVEDGHRVAYASEAIDQAHPLRRLLVGALVAGECGSAGLP